MKRQLHRLYIMLTQFGLDPRMAMRACKGLPGFFRNLRTLKRQQKSGVDDFPIGPLQPCLHDRHAEGQRMEGHYFHQDLLVAAKIIARRPQRHVDVGSRIDGFVAHVAASRPIEVFDIRKIVTPIANVSFVQFDLTSRLPDAYVHYCDSLSCLHALEHFGLGRYGDPVRRDGHIVGLNNLFSMLKKDGAFYLSVPIGPQRIEFDAYRVFSLKYLLDLVRDRCDVNSFSFVDDNGDLHENVALADEDVRLNFGCYYGCGILDMKIR